MYDYSLPKKEGQSKKWLVIPTFILAVLFVILVKNTTSPQKIDSPIVPTKTKQERETKTKAQEEVLNKIREILKDKPGSYSIYISDFSNKDSFGINENTIFKAASVNKIAVLAALYHLADKGEVNLDEAITLQEEDIQDYGTGSLRYAKPGTVYSVKTLARLMMEKSDNTAAHIIGDQIIGIDKIQDLINQWGLKQTSMVDNKTSNTDQALLLSMVYQNKIASSSLTKEMLDFMDDSDFEDRIPALLPKDIKIYHKTGNEIRNVHDVGIIDPPAGRPYYLGVMTTDNPDDGDANKIISQISKVVYDYFVKKPKN